MRILHFPAEKEEFARGLDPVRASGMNSGNIAGPPQIMSHPLAMIDLRGKLNDGHV